MERKQYIPHSIINSQLEMFNNWKSFKDYLVDACRSLCDFSGSCTWKFSLLCKDMERKQYILHLIINSQLEMFNLD